MLVGVITGSYSSIFVAAPILVDLGLRKKIKSGSAAVKPGEKAVPAKA
jgi:SecD/SecF fusion protein